jgi:tripartite-type tricarboxylate transporter receptor subunit TctC
MTTTRRGVIAAALVAAPAVARAQAAWPGDRPIQLIVPFPPGGGTDINIRAMVPFFEKHLPGARFVVVNRPGAGAEIGYTAAATAAADGYTIGTVITPSLQTNTIERTPRYALRDFAFLGTVVEDPGGFFVAPNSPWRTVADLVQAAKAAPGTIAVATAGIGSDDHLLMIEFENAAGVRLNHVPFAGQAPGVTALIGGHVQVASMNMGESVGMMREGRVRALAAAGPARFPMAPDVPTFAEAGYPIDTGVVRSLVVPVATPAPILQRLQAMLAETMRDPAWIAEAQRLFIPLQYRSPEDTYRIVWDADRALRALWARRPWKDS